MLLWLASTERIGSPYLGFFISLAVFLIAFYAVWVLYRRFVKKVRTTEADD